MTGVRLRHKLAITQAYVAATRTFGGLNETEQSQTLNYLKLDSKTTKHTRFSFVCSRPHLAPAFVLPRAPTTTSGPGENGGGKNGDVGRRGCTDETRNEYNLNMNINYKTKINTCFEVD